MQKIILGGTAALIGIVCVSKFFSSFLDLIFGTLPIVLILGGLVAFYLGFNEIQEAKKEEDSEDTPQPSSMAEDAADTRGLESDSQEKVPDQAVHDGQAGQTTDTSDTISPAQIKFKGNTDTLVFHSSDCKFAHGKKCTAEFAVRQGAIDQGYVPCKVCNP